MKNKLNQRSLNTIIDYHKEKKKCLLRLKKLVQEIENFNKESIGFIYERRIK